MAKRKKIWIVLGGLGVTYVCSLLAFTGDWGLASVALLLEFAYIIMATIVFMLGVNIFWKKVLIIPVVLIASFFCIAAVSRITRGLIKHSAIQAHKNNEAAFYVFPFDFKRIDEVPTRGELSQFRSNHSTYGVYVFKKDGDRFLVHLID